VAKSGGAILLGGLFASLLSGILLLQTILYFKFYPRDSSRLKSLVGITWFTDTVHSIFIWCSIWDYCVSNFGNQQYMDHIPWSIALTIVFTALMTFLVHCFYARRIFLLSRKAWPIAVSLVVLTFLRLLAASVSTAEMIRLKSFSQFVDHYHWVFTVGLSLSVSVDFLITCTLSVLLHSCRTGGERLNRVIDSLILCAFEAGSMTFIATIISLICWVVLPTNLIFLGLHFAIAKLYANSLLVTLNTRLTMHRNTPSYEVYDGSRVERSDPSFLVLSERRKRSNNESQKDRLSSHTSNDQKTLQINVERSIQYQVDTDNDIFDERGKAK